MGVFKNIFGKAKKVPERNFYDELGKYNARFTSFGPDIYQSDIVRTCVRTLAEHSSKAVFHCKDKNVENILNNHPNMYMNRKDFIYKIRTMLEVKNTAFVYVEKDAKANPISYYPVPRSEERRVGKEC